MYVIYFCMYISVPIQFVREYLVRITLFNVDFMILTCLIRNMSYVVNQFSIAPFQENFFSPANVFIEMDIVTVVGDEDRRKITISS
jgi:hypothetical protein